MPKTARCFGMIAGVLFTAFVGWAPVARGSVSLTFSDKDPTPTFTTVVQGGTFGVAVYINLSSASDDVSGLDYRLQISTAGSGYFKVLSRTSTSVFTPYFNDTSSSVAPVTLSPDNGATNLGGYRPANDLTGAGAYEVADYTLMLSSGTPIGAYTLNLTKYNGSSFSLPSYEGGLPNFAAAPVDSVGIYTINVTAAAPEPTSALTLFFAGSGLFTLARPRRRRATPADAA